MLFLWFSINYGLLHGMIVVEINSFGILKNVDKRVGGC
jgi:hypothetical protein